MRFKTSIEQMIRQLKAEGGRFHWIATFYSLPQDQEATGIPDGGLDTIWW